MDQQDQQGSGMNTATEKAVVTAGESPVTWEEFEQIEHSQRREKIQKKKEELEIEKEAKSKIAKKGGETHEKSKEAGDKEEASEKNQEVSSKKDSKSKDDSEDEATTKKESKGKDDDDADSEKSSETKKTVKLDEDSGESFAVPVDAKLTVVVDGKPQKVKFQDLINNYSGNKHLDQRYQSFKKEQQTVERDKKYLSSVTETLKELVEKKDGFGIIFHTAESLGKDPVEISDEMEKNMEELVEKLSLMTPEERERARLERRASLLQAHLKRQKDQKSRSDQDAAKFAEMEEARTTLGLERAEFVSILKEMKQHGATDAQLTKDVVVRFARNVGQFDKAKKALETYSSEVKDMNAAVKEIYDLILPHYDLTQEDVNQIAKELYGKIPEKRIATKPGYKNTIKNVEKNRNPDKDAMFFDDIM